MRKALSNNSEVIRWNHAIALGFPLVIESADDRQVSFVSSFKDVCFTGGFVSIIECVEVLLCLSAVGLVSDDIVDLTLFDDFPVLFDWVFYVFFL